MKKSAKNSYVRFILIALIVVLAGAGAVSALNLPGLGKFEKVKPTNGVVNIPLEKVSDGKAHFFKYSEGGKDILFFAVKSPDGSIKTAFDACDVCFREKKGYVQEGDFVVCKQCGKKFATARIGQGSGGGCNPSFLPHQQAGNSIVVSVADLKSGTRFF